MDVGEAVRLRKSIRGFKPEPVPEEIIREILNAARRSPSAVNVQPWEFTVVAGEVLEQIRQANVEMLVSGTTPSRNGAVQGFQGVYRERQVNLAKTILGLLGIAREDKSMRAEWNKKGFRLFEAPAAVFISIDASLDYSYAAFDLGCISQTICLLALKHGLGTCIAGQGVMYPEVIRKIAGIPDTKKLVISIAMGYPDWDFPANALESEREPLEKISTWLGFSG